MSNRLTLPTDICQRSDNLGELIDFVFPDIGTQQLSPEFFAKRAIAVPTAPDAADVNDIVSARLPGQERLSADVLVEPTPQQEWTIMPEDLHAIQLPDMPDHRLNLHVGMPCILMRDLFPALAGTVVIINQISTHIIKVQCLSSIAQDTEKFLFRMSFTSPDLGFVFKRKQYPIKPAYAVTAESLRGREMDAVALYVPRSVSHNDLCMVCTRVRSPKDLKILIMGRSDPDGWRKVKVFDFRAVYQYEPDEPPAASWYRGSQHDT